MTVEIKNLKTGNIIKEKFVTDIHIDGEWISLEYDRRIRTTLVGKRVPMDMYAVENMYR